MSRPRRRRRRRGHDKETGSISIVDHSTAARSWSTTAIVDVRAVRANVERLHAQKPEWGVMVVADQNAETGLLVQVIDQVRQGGVENVSFGTSSR